jgi:hypothetical protein
MRLLAAARAHPVEQSSDSTRALRLELELELELDMPPLNNPAIVISHRSKVDP